MDATKRMDELERDLRAAREDLAELRGEVRQIGVRVDTIITIMNRIDVSAEKASSVKTAITFAGVVIVPILVALIGGWLVLKSGGVTPR